MSQRPGHRQPSTPYGPLQRRLLALAGLLSVLLIAVIAFHALHTGSTGLNAVAEAAQRTARQPGAKLAMEVTYKAEGLPDGSTRSIVGNGYGAYNARTGRTQFSLTVPLPGKAPVTVETIGDDHQVFVRSPMYSAEVPEGKEWIGMEPLLGAASQSAFGSSGGAKSDLDVLQAVDGGVQKLDQQTVRGHLTTRYKASVDLSREAQLLEEDGETEAARVVGVGAEQLTGPVEVEAWIDGHGLTRQIRMVEQIATGEGPTITVDMRMQLYAFGSHPKIQFPPKADVYDYTPKLREELGLSRGTSA
jgi:hypothetical protein